MDPYLYYSKRNDLVIEIFPSGEDGFVNSDRITELESAINNYERVWLVLSHSRDPSNLILNMLNDTYVEFDSKDWAGINTYLFVK